MKKSHNLTAGTFGANPGSKKIKLLSAYNNFSIR
jgi:hypothetical protein